MSSRMLILLMLAIGSASQIVAAAPGKLPNIVLVMADDQGWGEMGYNGHSHVKTPNFDKAAATGIRFDRFYAAAPVCSPTRASVMTGRHPNRMGVFKWGYPMRPQEITVAEALKTAGYTTGHFGKWHLGSVRTDSPANPGVNGFDEWLSAPNYYDNGSILSRRGTAVKTKGESSEVAVDAALSWIDQSKAADKPFLAVVWFGSPHSPHRAAEQDRALYEDRPEKEQHFFGEITGMDRAFGKLRDGLGDRGIRDNTILWYCSDNGALPKIGSSGGLRGNKGKVYEGGLLVPAILEWPAVIKENRTSDIRCNTCDIYPTLLDIAGVAIDNQPVVDGISLSPLIHGESFKRSRSMGFWDTLANGVGTPSDTWMNELYAAQQNGNDLPPHQSSVIAAKLPDPPYSTTSFPGHAAWVDGDWKLHRIENAKGKLTWELYDLKNDRTESTDLKAKRAEVVDRLQPKLAKWLTSVTNSLNGADY
ncbi:sulfatase-like hydrolase/transferase [Stieleria marina]|uniref:Arylsulfatase n=1 Tax=Stieleria marina TaxID=1930275 RepID=A0A517NYF2_9BACT|nr:Arylsulfatase precursor [Planctomycetes bacterium K23_9]